MSSDLRNYGHGHVRPRPDGVRARCGGPALCKTCALEKAQMDHLKLLATEMEVDAESATNNRDKWR